MCRHVIVVPSCASGLRSQCNFVGCLRSLYFNHNAILEKADEDRTKIHGSNPQLGCQDMNQRILQFTHQGAFVKVEHSASDSLEVVLQFRTLKPDAVLVYSLAHSGGDDGYIQVQLVKYVFPELLNTANIEDGSYILSAIKLVSIELIGMMRIGL